MIAPDAYPCPAHERHATNMANSNTANPLEGKMSKEIEQTRCPACGAHSSKTPASDGYIRFNCQAHGDFEIHADMAEFSRQNPVHMKKLSAKISELRAVKSGVIRIKYGLDSLTELKR